MGRHVEREILSALIDGELEPAQRRTVHEHLQSCDDCREALEEFGQIHGMIGELPRLVAPAAFVSSVAVREPRTGIAERMRAGLWAGRRRWATIAVSTAAVATTLAGLVVPERTEPVPVGAFVERHASIHAEVEPGAQVVFTANGR